jgi:hypothetical protein
LVCRFAKVKVDYESSLYRNEQLRWASGSGGNQRGQIELQSARQKLSKHVFTASKTELIFYGKIYKCCQVQSYSWQAAGI